MSGDVMRLTCPACNKPMKALTRPPKLKHTNNNSSLATNYCVCLHCGRRGKAEITVVLFVEQNDWVSEFMPIDTN